MKTMPAGKFKAQCLAVMDEVQARREPVLVTKNGRPVAKLVPIDLDQEGDPLEVFRFPGKIEIIGDIVSPLYSDEELSESFDRSLDVFK